MNVKKHKDIPGYIAERRVPEGNGEVVCYDGYVEGITTGRDRWVVQHFPSNGMAFFTSQKKARAALAALNRGKDEWNILSDPTEVSETTSITPHLTESFDEALVRKVDVDAMIDRILDRSKNATLHRKVGADIEEVPDHKTRHESDKLLISYLVGMPIAKQVNIYRKEETFDDLIDRCREKPEWARGVADVINRIADEAEQTQ